MSQIAYRGNLSAAYFPFLSQQSGQTVIVGGPDNNFVRQLQSSADVDKDIGIPQAYYMHNVMPNGNGLQSVGYETQTDGPLGPTTNLGIEREFVVRDDSVGQKAFVFVSTGQTIYIYQGAGPSWTAQTGYWNGGVFTLFPIALTNNSITVAHVSGVTYFNIGNIATLNYNFATNRFERVVLAGLVDAEVIGVTESNGYLLAYSTTTIAWSSTIDPTDFVPSLQTGAGGGGVEGIKGLITVCVPTSQGFIVYSETNAVAAFHTGNSRYPFQFNECVGAGGVNSLERVTYESDTGYNYAYTTKGFQILQAKQAQTTFPDLTDFLAGQYFEDYDDIYNIFTRTTVTTPLLKKLVFVATRYLVISYGITEYTHALVYDVAQKRFGKLKHTHVDCFEFEYVNTAISDIPRKSLALVDKCGNIVTADFSVSHTSRPGVLILGKFQYARSRRLSLQEATFEWVLPSSDVSIYCAPTQDGKTPDPLITGVPLVTGTDVRTYGFGAPDGVNHSLILNGTFNLDTFVLKFNVTSRT